jgi:dipicolinate synthase subunit A
MMFVSVLSAGEKKRPDVSDSKRRRKRGLFVWRPVAASVTPGASGVSQWRQPSWLVRRFWRDLEIVLRWIFLDAQERKAHPLSSRIRAPLSREPESAKSPPARPDFGPASECSVNVLPGVEAARSKPTRDILVAGRTKIADGLLRCILAEGLLAEGVNLHAIAADVNGCRDLIAQGVTPHLLEDIPSQAARFDLILSMDLMHFIGAEVLTRLPEHAVILDLAPPPGSVDYEAAKKIGRKVIWAPSPVAGRLAGLGPETWGKCRTVLDTMRHLPIPR